MARFAAEGETYKVEIAEGLPEGEQVTFYEQDGFVDLCRGPHLQTTKPIKAFKLTSLAGAYWRGDSDKPMLTRIYGTAFFDQAELDAHLERIEEARRRDHRRLGRELDLFHLSDTSPGSPFWHPRGMVLFNELGRLWRELNASRGYEEVKTPILFGTELWKRSGHWDNYRDKMFLTEQVEGRQFGLKPMNCPGHVEIYNHAPALLPRPAAAARRAGPRAPQRGLGLDARAAARAAHHAGRRAHLLPLGSGRGGGRRLPRSRERDLRDVRPRRARRALDPARRSASAARRSGIAWRPRSPPRSRRRAGTSS